MLLHRVLRLTNTRIRLAVGLGLLGMICLQCTQSSEAFRDSQIITATDGQLHGQTSDARARHIEQLAETDPVALLQMALDNYDASIQDYRATFVKQERIHGRIRKEQVMEVHFRDEPFSVFMHWTENPPRADRMLYVAGRNEGQMLVRPAGLLASLGTLQRDPEGEDVMENTLRPVTQFGFRRSLESLLEVYRLADERGDLQSDFEGYAEVDGRPVLVLVRTLPPRDDYPAKTTRIYLDRELLLPLAIEAMNWQDELDSRYIYRDVRLNVGLTDADFAPENNGM